MIPLALALTPPGPADEPAEPVITVELSPDAPHVAAVRASVPPTAAVWIDLVPAALGAPPAAIALEIRAEGYRPARREVLLEGSVEIVVPLRRPAPPS